MELFRIIDSPLKSFDSPIPEEDFNAFQLINELPCVGVRMPELGHWCGYVAANLTEEQTYDFDVHGGATWNDTYPELSLSLSLPINTNWIGFDCAHVGDLVPLYPASGTYRTADYVANELTKLTKQVINAPSAAK